MTHFHLTPNSPWYAVFPKDFELEDMTLGVVLLDSRSCLVTHCNDEVSYGTLSTYHIAGALLSPSPFCPMRNYNGLRRNEDHCHFSDGEVRG